MTIKTIKPIPAASKENIMAAIRQVLKTAMDNEVLKISVVLRYKRPTGEQIDSTFEVTADKGAPGFLNL